MMFETFVYTWQVQCHIDARDLTREKNDVCRRFLEPRPVYLHGLSPPQTHPRGPKINGNVRFLNSLHSEGDINWFFSYNFNSIHYALIKIKMCRKHNLFMFVQEYNATIEFYWAPFLLESNSDNAIVHRISDRIVRRGSINKHGKNWKGVDIMVFNTYLWWMTGLRMKIL